MLFDKLLLSPPSGAASQGPGAACLPGARRLPGVCVGEAGVGAVDGTEPWLRATTSLCYLEYNACTFWSHLEIAIT